MTSFRAVVAATASLALLGSGSAHALFRTYLSLNGLDTNPCTLQQPCRLLPKALSVTDPGGEVWMLDSANYNTSTVTIDKSVTILAIPGAVGSVVGNGGTAINIGGAGITVALRNLVVRNLSGGDIGILIGDAAQVTINNCEIFGFTTTSDLGIWVVPPTGPTRVNIVGSIVRNNYHGIIVAGNARATISKTHVFGNVTWGILAGNAASGDSYVHVTDSVSSGNSVGFASSGTTQGGTNSLMFVTRSLASENSTAGFQTEGGTTAFMAVGESMSTDNGIGFNKAAAGSTFLSRGDNTVIGNPGGNTVGTIGALSGI